MNYIDHLILRAERYWRIGEDLPLHLYCKMQEEGLIVEELKVKYLRNN